MKKIKENYKIFVPANKLRNSYLLSKDEYQKLFQEYNKDIHKEKNEFTIPTTKNRQQNSIQQTTTRMEYTRMNQILTIKNHRNDDFPNKISCGLINPSKSDIEKNK